MCEKAEKGEFLAEVAANTAISRRFYKLSLRLSGHAAALFAAATPGQFVQLDASKLSLPQLADVPEDLADASQRCILLRRPFSFCDVIAENRNKTRIEIVYCVLGPATLRMTTLAKGDRLSIIGPLGNGFSVPEGKRVALLVAGGMGAPPILHLAKVLRTNHSDIDVTAFLGAKTIADLPFELSSAEIATEDGSAGFAGLVTDCLSQWLDKNTIAAEQTIIYTCGPEPMLAAVAKIAKICNIDCQESLERMMACGIGICQSCAVECRQQTRKETIYKLCCKDGPVFDAKDIVWNC